MLTFLSAKVGPLGDRRCRYQHPDLGVLDVSITHGASGSADIVWLYGAMWEARCDRGDFERAHVLSACDVEYESALAKRPRRKRQPRGSD